MLIYTNVLGLIKHPLGTYREIILNTNQLAILIAIKTKGSDENDSLFAGNKTFLIGTTNNDKAYMKLLFRLLVMLKM